MQPNAAAFVSHRPRKLNPDQAQLACELVEQGKAVRDIARTFDVHVATFYRVVSIA